MNCFMNCLSMAITLIFYGKLNFMIDCWFCCTLICLFLQQQSHENEINVQSDWIMVQSLIHICMRTSNQTINLTRNMFSYPTVPKICKFLDLSNYLCILFVLFREKHKRVANGNCWHDHWQSNTLVTETFSHFHELFYSKSSIFKFILHNVLLYPLFWKLESTFMCQHLSFMKRNTFLLWMNTFLMHRI